MPQSYPSPRFPYFKFFAADWQTSASVQAMGRHQQGAYVWLLCLCWQSQDCSLPADPEVFRRLAALPEEAIGPVRAMFISHPRKKDCLTNRRMYLEWCEARERWLGQSQGGKNSGKSRRSTFNGTSEHLLGTSEVPSQYSESESESESDTDKEKEKTIVGLTPNGVWQEVEALLNFLNEKTGKQFRLRTPKGEWTKGAHAIHALLKKHYTPVEIKQVIANRWLKWQHDPAMKEYLRPETLFRPSKFESYLGELGVTK